MDPPSELRQSSGGEPTAEYISCGTRNPVVSGGTGQGTGVQLSLHTY